MSSQGISSSLDGQESKRLACERCRAQKLKCVRIDLSQTCQRCSSAKTLCSFGRPLPPGRPPTVTNFTREQAANNAIPNPGAFRHNESTTSNLSLESQSNHSDKHNFQSRTLLNHPIDPTYREGQWSQASTLADEEFLDMLKDDTLMVDLDSSTFGNWPTAPDKSMGDSPPRQATEQPSRAGSDLSHLINSSVPVTSAESRMPTQSHRPDLTIHTAHDKRQMNGPSPSSNRPTQILGKSGDLSAIQHPPALMQRLMHLGSVMYELQSTYSPDEHGNHPTSVSSNTFPIELAGKVLQVATEFLKSLRCFFSLDDSLSSSSNPSSVRRRGPSMSVFGDGDDRNLHQVTGRYQNFPDPMSRPSSAYTPPPSSRSSSEWPPRRVVAASKSTTLQLIANYLGLLQLYQLLYNAVYDYARLTESEFRQSQPIWKDLTIGDAPLYQFADIQINLVLQVAARLLEDIEAALGLTENCRVSKKSATEGSGILGMNVTAHFIEMCMSEVTTGLEHGRGTVARLRDIMQCLTDMLDVPIFL